MKLLQTIAQARRDGKDYVWVDTCCIDKDSSTELQDAINSMFVWYGGAAVCHAYLDDVPDDVDVFAVDSKFCKSEWFQRGWTLQELIAPHDLIFFSQNWIPLGDKVQLQQPIEAVTRIDADILTGAMPVETASVAKRMSWAARRKTTRIEDQAYCLIGLFDVSMPMLYGECRKAFLRLQEEIMKQSDDHSLFAWVDNSPKAKSDPEKLHGLLADSPASFDFPEANSIVPYSSWERESPYGMTNRGLDIELHRMPLDADGTRHIAALHCPSPSGKGEFLAVILKKLNPGTDDDKFARVECHKLRTVSERGERLPTFIPQKFASTAGKGLYPLHVFQLEKLPAPYKVAKIVRNADFGEADKHMLPGIDPTRTFKVIKKAHTVSVVLLVQNQSNDEFFVVRLGSLSQFQAGFDIRQALPVPLEEYLQDAFNPWKSGAGVTLPHHYVQVDMGDNVVYGVKFHHVRLTVQGFTDEGATVKMAKAVKEIAVPHYQAVQSRSGFLRGMGLRR